MDSHPVVGDRKSTIFSTFSTTKTIMFRVSRQYHHPCGDLHAQENLVSRGGVKVTPIARNKQTAGKNHPPKNTRESQVSLER